jgi:hypothetical protein
VEHPSTLATMRILTLNFVAEQHYLLLQIIILTRLVSRSLAAYTAHLISYLCRVLFRSLKR